MKKRFSYAAEEAVPLRRVMLKLKRCSKCGLEKPATTDFFCRRSSSIDGLRYECKDCQQESQRDLRIRKGLCVRYLPPHGLKRCPKCGLDKPATVEFFGRNNGFLYTYCRPCASRRQTEIRKASPEKYKNQQRLKYSRHRESILEQMRYRYASDTEFRERRNRYNLSWARQNVEAFKAIQHRHRSSKRSASGSHTQIDLTKMLETQLGCCFYCEAGIRHSYQIDHMVPLSRGGSNGIDNLCCTCRSCNTSKGAKTVEEFVRYRLRRGLHVRSALIPRRGIKAA